MNASVFQVMKDTGKAINDTFHKNVALMEAIVGKCTAGVVTLPIPAGTEFDYIVSAEDMRMGARFANYSIECVSACDCFLVLCLLQQAVRLRSVDSRISSSKTLISGIAFHDGVL